VDFSVTVTSSETTPTNATGGKDTSCEKTSPNRWQVLSIVGEIDMATAPRFRQQLLEVINAGHPYVVLDLSQVDFMDSTGLGVLIGAVKRVRSANGDIRLVQGNSRVAELLEITKLNKAISVFSSVAEATHALPETPGHTENIPPTHTEQAQN